MLHSISIADNIRFRYDDFHFAGITNCLNNKSRIAYFVHFFPCGDHFDVLLYQCNPLVAKSWELLKYANSTTFPLFVRFSSPRLRLRPDGVIEIAFLVATTVTIARRTVFDPYMAIINAFPPLHLCRFIIEPREGGVSLKQLPLKDFVYGDISKLSLWPSENDDQWIMAEASMCDVYRLKIEGHHVMTDGRVGMPVEMRERLFDSSIDRNWSSFPAVLLRDATNDIVYLGLLSNNVWVSYMPCDIHRDAIFADSKFCFVGDKLLAIRPKESAIRCQFIVLDNYSRTFQVVNFADVPFRLDIERLIPGDTSTVQLVRHDRSVRILFTNMLSLTELCTMALMKLFGAVNNPLTDTWSGGISQSELRNQLKIKGDILLY